MNDSIRSIARSGNPRRASRATRAVDAAPVAGHLPDDRRLFEEMPAACLVLARDGSVRQGNRAARQLLGLAPGARPVALQACIADDALPALEDFLQQCFAAAGLQVASCELPLSAALPDAQAVRWIRLEGRLDTQPQPEDCTAIVIAHDISAERVAAQAIRQQLDFYTNLCSRIPGILFQYRLDPDGSTCFPYVSESIPRMYGVTQAQAQADAGHLLEHVHPDDLASLHVSMRVSAETLQRWRHEYRMMLPSGEIRWRALEAHPEALANGSVLWHGYTIDISERMRLQATVQQHAERCKLVLEEVGDGVWDWDVASGVVNYSTRWKAMLGYAADEIGTSPEEWSGRVHPDDLPITESNGRQLTDGVTEHTSIEVRLRARDGSWRWILSRAAVVSRDLAGRPLRIIGTNVDITEHRQLEEAVHENEKRWKLALEALGHGFWEWELTTNKCAYSTQWKAILGYAEDEVRDDASEWMTRLHPDDLSVIDESFRSLIVREKASDNLEFRMRCKDGSWKWVQGSGILVEQGVQGPRIVGGMIDISERKRVEEALRSSEERWKFALEGAGDGVWDWDVLASRIGFSPRSIQMLGLGSDEVEHDYDTWCKRVHPDDVERGTKNREHSTQQGIDTSSVEMRVRHGNGSWIWLQSRGLVVKRDEHGNALRLVGTIRDITERKAEEERLYQVMQEIDARRLEAEQLAAAKANFLNAASHDLRQPLYAAQLFADALGQDALAPAQQRIANSLQLAIKSMSAQLEMLLDISRFDMGKLEAHKCDVSLVQLLRKIEATYGPIARKADVALFVRPIDGVVNTDPVLFCRLLGNLVDNAIKFSVLGNVLVCARRSRAGFRIEVRDNGPGIAAEYSRKIFDEYFQIGNPERNSGAGLGLGLSIVQRIAHLLELNLDLRSEPGRGTVFSVVLPAVRCRRRRAR